MHNARFAPDGGAQPFEYAVIGVANRGADPVLIDQVGRAHDLLLDEPVARGQRDVKRLDHERHASQAGLVPVGRDSLGVGDHDVVVGGELGEVGQGQVMIGEYDVEARLAAQGHQRTGQQHLPRGRERADRDGPLRALLELVPQRVGGLDSDGDASCRVGEGEAGAGEHEAASLPLGER